MVWLRAYVHMCLCFLALLIHRRTSSPVAKTKKPKERLRGVRALQLPMASPTHAAF